MCKIDLDATHKLIPRDIHDKSVSLYAQNYIERSVPHEQGSVKHPDIHNHLER